MVFFLLLFTLSAEATSYSDFVRGDTLPSYEKLPHRILEELTLSSEQWREPQTRLRLRQLFEHYVYGYAPTEPTLKATIVEHKEIKLFNGSAVDYWDIDLVPQLPGVPAKSWRLNLFLPTSQKKHRLILALNKCGNHTVVEHVDVRPRDLGFILDACKEDEYQAQEHQHFWNVHTMVKRGYGFATLHESDIAPDDQDRMRERAMGHYKEAIYTSEHAWGALAAWAWGLRSIVGHLQNHELIDGSKIVTMGHSRRGKAALIAAAFDERIAGVIPHQSGFLGMATARRTWEGLELGVWARFKAWAMSVFRENIFLMRRQFPHWLSAYTLHFEGSEARLPVDQHLLVGLVAPRFVLSTEGETDYWANYPSALWSLKTAETQTLVPAGRFSQIRVDTGHTMTLSYWPPILDFLDRNL